MELTQKLQGIVAESQESSNTKIRQGCKFFVPEPRPVGTFGVLSRKLGEGMSVFWYRFLLYLFVFNDS
jgi:hypothetical protein